MSGSSNPVFPSPEEGVLLHRRLCHGDATASLDLCRAYLPHLLAWMEQKFPRVDPDEREEAVHVALVSLIKNAGSYDPARSDLFAYLRMAARGDLLNLLQREKRHHAKRIPWQAVEHSPDAGKYLGREDDPCLGLLAAEEQTAADPIGAAVADGLSDPERRVVELMRRGERRTRIFAEALGLDGLTKEEEFREVKRVKDKIKARWKRAGGSRE